MPTFSTPSPIDLAIHLPVGRIDVIASDRTDTVVTVSPTTASKPADVRGAEETKVDLTGNRLTITGPKPRFSIIGPSESVDLQVELPTGSRLTAEISVGSVRATGILAATRIKNSTGAVELDAVGDLWVRASHGSTDVGSADGSVEITADHGQIRLGSVAGDALLKSSYGNVQIEEIHGDLEAKLSYGDLDVARTTGSVTAKSAYGSIRLDDVAAGSVQIESGYGQVSVGVHEGVAAWLDLASKIGRVRNDLAGDTAPGESDPSVAVRVRAQGGDITIKRAR